ncbi:MAG: PAS domain-containing protein [Planctomycetaceae bacterium]|nr:PAS domain-containing protein [Planctomycetaceae bacterium]
MLSWLTHIFETRGFAPRWTCGTGWSQEPFWGWAIIIADLLIAAAYLAIPLVLVYFIRRRQDLPFPRIFWLFGAFILACGATHLMEAIIFWWPAYRFSAVLKMATAVVSLGTAFSLLTIAPAAISLRSPRQMEAEVRRRVLELEQLTAQLRSEVAAREVAERTLRESEERLRMALRAGRMGTWDWDLQANETRVNSTEFDLFSMEGRNRPVPIESLFKQIHPDDERRIRDAVRKAIGERGEFHEEFRVLRGEEETRWLVGRAEVLADSRNVPVRMVGINYDVTDRKVAALRLQQEMSARKTAQQQLERSEGWLRMVLRAGGMGTWDWDIRGKTAVLDAKEIEILGLDLESGRHPDSIFFERVHPQDADRLMGTLNQCIEDRSEYDSEFRVVLPDGETRWLAGRGALIKDSDGRPARLVGVNFNITERKEFERSLEIARQQANAANRAKSEFLANMSHEIRTPLAAILGSADALYPRIEQEEQRELLRMIRSQGGLLLGILNDILDLSKIEAGRLEILPEPTSVKAVVEEVRSLMSPQASEKGLNLSTEFDGKIPARIQTDPLRVRQILLNLVGNAVKFTDAGSVTIGVRCEIADGLAYIVLSVRDTGVGIPPDQTEAIFEAFSQGNQEITRKYGGTGLGLTICEKLVRLLSGKISVRSELGRGAEFCVELPAGEVSTLQLVDPKALTESNEAGTDGPEFGRLPIRVLVVEDNRGLQIMLKRMLENHVDLVELANNGEAAISEIARAATADAPYDIVLMDMHMPVLNGFDATQRLRAKGYHLPIVALTAGAMSGDRDRCLQAGCDNYLSKPVDRGRLLNLLAEYHRKAVAADSRE